MSKKNLIIIGAGLSGLYVATLLQEEFNITILEARDRVGGRILTQAGHDLGPSWIWPHQKNILGLVNSLGLELFSQYVKGNALYDAPDGVQSFKAPPSAASARMDGGLEKLIEALASKLPSEILYLNEEVVSICQDKSALLVQTKNDEYKAEYVLSTLPPRVAVENIEYIPSLDEETKRKLKSIPTWMGNSAKCVVEFEKAFWKDEGLSGFVYSPLGPLGEIHDASTQEKAALFGFINAKASTTNIEEDIRRQMQRLFADKSKLIRKIYFTDWREEKFSSTLSDRKALSIHPEYGLSLNAFDEKLFFMGTETAYTNGGYLEGAVISALEMEKRVSHLS